MCKTEAVVKPGFHKANYDHDKERFQAKTK